MKAIKDRKKSDSRLIFIVVAALLALTYLILSFIASTVKEEDIELQLSKELPGPQFSKPYGFYNKEFLLNITSTTPGARIYYTTDGSTPTEDSELYSKPLLIKNRESEPNGISEIPTSPTWKSPLNKVFKGTVVKAITVVKNKKSVETAASYFVHPKGFSRYSLPIMSFTVNPADFFSYMRGIYVRGKTFDDKDYYLRTKQNIAKNNDWWFYPSNYRQKGMDWERPVRVNYIDYNNKKGFTLNAGVRIHGNATRGFPQKSLRIHFRDLYGQPALNFPLFKNGEVSTFKSLLLRNSGQDITLTMFRDALMQELIRETNLATQAYQPCILFINGEYWGIYNIRERLDADYVATRGNIPPDSIAIVQTPGKLIHGKPGDEKAYLDIIAFAKTHDLSKPENYRHMAQWIDIENFIDYLIAEIFYANTDWPWNNMEMWRYKHPTNSTPTPGMRDGRWRWFVFDTDAGFFTSPGHKNRNMLEYVSRSKELGPLFNSLMKNPEFRGLFFDWFEYHLSYTFETKRVLAKINEMQSALAPEMKEQINRWRVPRSYASWESEVNVLREFAKSSPAYLRQHLANFKKKYESRNP